MTYNAHSRRNEEKNNWQLLKEHLMNTAALAETFGVDGGMHERLARNLHQNYLTTSIANPGDPQSCQPWDALSEKLKEANRQQADRIERLLNSTGYRITPLQDWDAGEYIFESEEMENMARLEHKLWCDYKKKEGWQQGEVKDGKRRMYPNLLPWEDLSESERQKNRVLVQQFPALLSKIGFQIEKNRLLLVANE